MKRRDAIVEDLHKLRERIGRAHDFDVDRIAATIRQHEREAGRVPAGVAPTRTARTEAAWPTGCPTTRWSRRRVS